MTGNIISGTGVGGEARLWSRCVKTTVMKGGGVQQGSRPRLAWRPKMPGRVVVRAARGLVVLTQRFPLERADAVLCGPKKWEADKVVE